MNMLQTNRKSLLALILKVNPHDRFICVDMNHIQMDALETGLSVSNLESFRYKSVLISTNNQLSTVLAAIALDGVARRILLSTPELTPHLPSIVQAAQVDAVLGDRPNPAVGVPFIGVSAIPEHPGYSTNRDVETEWILFTSGTTGQPKMAIHTLSSLSGPLDDGLTVARGTVWSTFYDIRRYGGLQILLRALLGGGSMVLSSPEEETRHFFRRIHDCGVTHISGTPSHWRKAIMSPAINRMSPQYVRLSGEIADQAILDNLQRTYPAANIAHAFASTEAGVAFDVRDGKAGFPASLVNDPGAKAQIRVIGGTLHIRSPRTASGYVGQSLKETDGFVDTGDLVVKDGDRYYFKGRKEGVINVGGRKVYPEEVEAVLDLHPAIRMTRVRARNSPIMGAIVIADVVLADPSANLAEIRADLIKHCRYYLAAWKVPASLHQVATVELSAAGKIARYA